MSTVMKRDCKRACCEILSSTDLPNRAGHHMHQFVVGIGVFDCMSSTYNTTRTGVKHSSDPLRATVTEYEQAKSRSSCMVDMQSHEI